MAIAAWGLRDKFASETTGSAYSVFNTNGQAIAGGFTMNQLDRQLRGGFGSPSGGDGSIMAQAIASNNADTSTKAKRLSETERMRRRKDAAAAAVKRANTHS